MLINLCVLHLAQYFCISSSLLSCSWFSRPPLKGMTRAPGSWLSTHSLIFTSLAEMETQQVEKYFARVCYPQWCEYSCWRGLIECTAVCVRLRYWMWSFLFFSVSIQTLKSFEESDVWLIVAFVHKERFCKAEVTGVCFSCW